MTKKEYENRVKELIAAIRSKSEYPYMEDMIVLNHEGNMVKLKSVFRDNTNVIIHDDKVKKYGDKELKNLINTLTGYYRFNPDSIWRKYGVEK